jgi:hypothetical protein
MAERIHLAASKSIHVLLPLSSGGQDRNWRFAKNLLTNISVCAMI